MNQENNHSDSNFPSESTQRAAQQYQGTIEAKKYATKISGTGTDRREKKCIIESLALAKVPPGSSVLDIPCGPGRLFPMLKKYGFAITGADISKSMLEQANLYAGPNGTNCLDYKDKICVANIFDTGFEKEQFDAVICHRMFQYFSQSDERMLALKELRRISSGPLIVSFLCSWSIDALWRNIMYSLHLSRKRKCQPISPLTFTKEIRKAGFNIKCWIAMRLFLSQRWYVVLEPAQAPQNTLIDLFSSYRRIILSALKCFAVCAFAVLMPFLYIILL